MEHIGRAVAVATIGSAILKRILGKLQEADFFIYHGDGDAKYWHPQSDCNVIYLY